MSKEWKLVPVEPTKEMLEAGSREHAISPTNANPYHKYAAMIAAAPALPVCGEPVDAIPLSDCVPGWHSDYNDGLFATDDTVVKLYRHPPEVERLQEVIEQQKSLIASLRADLRDSYSIDAAVQEEHLDLEAAAKKLAACMDYPWEHMPEQGRASMREHAKAVINAALNNHEGARS